MNEVYETETFSKIYDSSDPQEKIWIDKVKNQISENLSVGKPILIAFGSKKDQQKIIDNIIRNKNELLSLITILF